MEKNIKIKLLEEYKYFFWEQKKVFPDIDYSRLDRVEKMLDVNGFSKEKEEAEAKEQKKYEIIEAKLLEDFCALMKEVGYYPIFTNSEKLMTIREELRKYDRMGYIRARAIEKFKETEEYKDLSPEVQTEFCVRWATV